MELSLVEVRQNFSKYLRELNKPIVIMSHKKPLAVLSPFTEEEQLYRSMKTGEITYDQYKRKMLGIGYQNLVDQKVLVKPSDVIASEKLENEKLKTRIEASEFLMDAVKFWSDRHSWHLCEHCGHMMKPVEKGIKNSIV